MDEVSSTISKDWVGLILLPGISSVAGLKFVYLCTAQAHIVNRVPQRRQGISQR